MKKFILFAFAAFAIFGCGNGSKTNTEVANDSVSVDSNSVQKRPELTDARLQQLVQAIPDHGKVKSPETTLSKEYYETWKKAMDIPSDGLGGIGSEEFLFYFVCGNDPCDSHTGKFISTKIDGDTATVKFYINHAYEVVDNPLRTFRLVIENGEWVIADYDNTLSQMKEYIEKQRKYLRSAEFRKEAQKILDDPAIDTDYEQIIKDNLKEIEDYFRENPDN